MRLDAAIESGLDKGYRIEHSSGITIYKVDSKHGVFVRDIKKDASDKRTYLKVTTLIPQPYLMETEKGNIPKLVDKADLFSLFAFDKYADWNIPEGDV